MRNEKAAGGCGSVVEAGVSGWWRTAPGGGGGWRPAGRPHLVHTMEVTLPAASTPATWPEDGGHNKQGSNVSQAASG